MIIINRSDVYRNEKYLCNVKHIRRVLLEYIKEDTTNMIVRFCPSKFKLQGILFYSEEKKLILLSGSEVYYLLTEKIEFLFGEYNRNSLLDNRQNRLDYYTVQLFIAKTNKQKVLEHAIKLALKYNIQCEFILANGAMHHTMKELLIELLAMHKICNEFKIDFIFNNIDNIDDDINNVMKKVLDYNHINEYGHFLNIDSLDIDFPILNNYTAHNSFIDFLDNHKK